MKLSTKARKAIPEKDFALPSKRSASGGKGGYPIPDKSHARNALARVSQHGTPAEKAEVRAKVHEKYPSIGRAHEKPMNKHGSRHDGPHEHLNPSASTFHKL